jgi:hypothetical protein
LDAHGNVRTLASFPSYELLEKSSPDSFEPSLKEIQEMVASVVIMKLKKPENSEKRVRCLPHPAIGRSHRG